MLYWTPERRAAAKKILSGSETIEDALSSISKALGPTSEDALERAFRRYGLPTPSSLLKPVTKKQPQTPIEYLKAKIENKERLRRRHQEGLTQLLMEKIECALEKIKPDTIQVTPEPLESRPAGAEEILWAEISDVQLGTKVQIEDVGGLNEHNWQIFLGKLERWEAGVAQVIRERRARVPVREVFISMIGDLVEGHGIFKGQAYELEVSVYEQVVQGARDFAQAFARLAATFPEIKFTLVGVGGNHGRVGSYGEAPYRANFDLLLMHIIELRLEALKLPNIECDFPAAWFQIVDTWGWRHLLVHGDDIKGWGGLPFYGMQRAVAKNSQMLQSVINYLHIGHHHTEAIMSNSVGRVLLNGNWIGGTAFAKQIQDANVPVQMVYGFTEADGLAWAHYIHLRPRVEMKPKLKVRRHGKTGGR